MLTEYLKHGIDRRLGHLGTSPAFRHSVGYDEQVSETGPLRVASPGPASKNHLRWFPAGCGREACRAFETEPAKERRALDIDGHPSSDRLRRYDCRLPLAFRRARCTHTYPSIEHPATTRTSLPPITASGRRRATTTRKNATATLSLRHSLTAIRNYFGVHLGLCTIAVEATHGSAKVSLSIDGDTFSVHAPFLRLGTEHRVPLMRRVAEVNFQPLTLPTIRLEEDVLSFEYDAPLELCEPEQVIRRPRRDSPELVIMRPESVPT